MSSMCLQVGGAEISGRRDIRRHRCQLAGADPTCIGVASLPCNLLLRLFSDADAILKLQAVNGSYRWQVAYHLDDTDGNPLAATLQQLYPRSVRVGNDIVCGSIMTHSMQHAGRCCRRQSTSVRHTDAQRGAQANCFSFLFFLHFK